MLCTTKKLKQQCYVPQKILKKSAQNYKFVDHIHPMYDPQHIKLSIQIQSNFLSIVFESMTLVKLILEFGKLRGVWENCMSLPSADTDEVERAKNSSKKWIAAMVGLVDERWKATDFRVWDLIVSYNGQSTWLCNLGY